VRQVGEVLPSTLPGKLKTGLKETTSNSIH
jgi:hypothetical protein